MNDECLWNSKYFCLFAFLTKLWGNFLRFSFVRFHLIKEKFVKTLNIFKENLENKQIRRKLIDQSCYASINVPKFHRLQQAVKLLKVNFSSLLIKKFPFQQTFQNFRSKIICLIKTRVFRAQQEFKARFQKFQLTFFVSIISNFYAFHVTFSNSPLQFKSD